MPALPRSIPAPDRIPALRTRIAGSLVVTLGAALLTAAGVSAAATPAVADDTVIGGGVVINEVESNNDDVDWIELLNTSGEPVDISGWVVKDDNDARTDTVASGTVLAAGEYFVFAEPAMTFGLGAADTARIFLPDGVTLVDQYAWSAHALTTYGRCPDGTGEFITTTSSTRGAPNDCSTPSPGPTPTDDPASDVIVINEVESNGDDTDWVELYNLGAEPFDLSGYIFRDNDDTRGYVLPVGSIVPAGGLLLIDQLTAHSPGFDFGLGNVDVVRIFAPDGVSLVASYEWSVHAATSYGRCPDGTGEMRETTVTTKDAPNNCALPVKINEVESSGGTPGDWIELVNLSDAAISVGGLVVTDSDVAGHRYAIPLGTEIAAKGYLVLDEADFGFGLGAADEVNLFDVDGTTLLDRTAWTAHAATTWGRCTDAVGPFTATAQPTKGAVNLCEGEVAVSPWPGAADVRVLDDEATFEGDLSGLFYADEVLWAVENGNGLLYSLTETGDSWSPATGWDTGKKLRYPDGTGTVDAEGITLVGGAAYVASERNNDQGSISRPAVLRFDPTAAGSELIATDEWNLAPDFPGLGANAGLEGITWIADSWLIENGFVDQNTGVLYEPGRYAGHGDGLFFVGVEGTASVYAYALSADGSFARVATISTDFAIVAEVQFDRGLLWIVCDETCDGRTATYEIDESGAFVATNVYARPAAAPNVANEGFAVDQACIDGQARTFYADDNDTDGHSLRGGSIACADAGGPSPTPTATQTPSATVTPTVSPTATPTVPGSSGAVAPDESDLTDENRGTIDAPDSVQAGGSIRVQLDPVLAGSTVHLWLFSTPTALGSAVVAADGSVVVRIPADVAPGEHRLVIADAEGNVIAWTELSVTARGGLAVSGGDGSAAGIAAIVGLLGLAAGAALLRRARRARA